MDFNRISPPVLASLLCDVYAGATAADRAKGENIYTLSNGAVYKNGKEFYSAAQWEWLTSFLPK